MDNNIVFVGVGFFAADVFSEEEKEERVEQCVEGPSQKQKKQKKKTNNEEKERFALYSHVNICARKHRDVCYKYIRSLSCTSLHSQATKKE
jgi:hypothetical protein